MPQSASAALSALIEVRGDEEGALFVNFDRAHKSNPLNGTAIYRLVRELGGRTGLKTRPHGLRHSAITEALDLTGGNVRSVQKYSRHSNVQTLLTYDDNRRDLAGDVAKSVSAKVDLGL